MMSVEDWIQSVRNWPWSSGPQWSEEEVAAIKGLGPKPLVINRIEYIDPIRADDAQSNSTERTVETVTNEIVGHLRAGRVGRQGKADIRDALNRSDTDSSLGRAIIGRVIP